MHRRAQDASPSIPSVGHAGMALLVALRVVVRALHRVACAIRSRLKRKKRVRVRLTLPAGALMSARAWKKVKVICLHGQVWVTRQGDPRDHVLLARTEHSFNGRSRVVIQAVEHAVVRICVG